MASPLAAARPSRFSFKASHRRMSLKCSHRGSEDAPAVRPVERERYIAPPKRRR